jgi:hypothetical protein
MSYASHYSQAGYNLVGEEAGIAMGKYVKQLSQSPEYKDKESVIKEVEKRIFKKKHC